MTGTFIDYVDSNEFVGVSWVEVGLIDTVFDKYDHVGVVSVEPDSTPEEMEAEARQEVFTGKAVFIVKHGDGKEAKIREAFRKWMSGQRESKS